MPNKQFTHSVMSCIYTDSVAVLWCLALQALQRRFAVAVYVAVHCCRKTARRADLTCCCSHASEIGPASTQKLRCSFFRWSTYQMSVVILHLYSHCCCMCTKVQPGIESVLKTLSFESKSNCVRLRFACSSRTSLRLLSMLK